MVVIHLQNPRPFCRAIAFALTAPLAAVVSADASVMLEINRTDTSPFVSYLTQTELDAMAQQTVDTATPYSHGEVRFSGPLLEDVLEKVMDDEIEQGTPITLTALNDYTVHTTVDVLSKADAIIATRKDGIRLSIRDRGPFWLILPLSDRPELDNENYHRLLVWHLHQIRIGE